MCVCVCECVSVCQGHEDRLTTHRGREQEKQQEEKTQTQVTERPQLSSRQAASRTPSRVQLSPTTYVTAKPGQGGPRRL